MSTDAMEQLDRLTASALGISVSELKRRLGLQPSPRSVPDAPVKSRTAGDLELEQCVVCNHPLRDARSVDARIGPVCRRGCGYDQLPEQVRQQANAIIQRLQFCLEDWHVVRAAAEDLRGIGAPRVADAVLRRIAGVRLRVKDDGSFKLNAPAAAGLSSSLNRFCSAGLSNGRIVAVVGAHQKAQLWTVLKQFFAGDLFDGPSGVTSIPPPAGHSRNPR